jgi:hypothetical protein
MNVEDKVAELSLQVQELRLKILQVENPIAYMFGGVSNQRSTKEASPGFYTQKVIVDGQEVTRHVYEPCNGNPCICAPNDIGRDWTAEEVAHYGKLRMHDMTPESTHIPPWPHVNNCGARDGLPCDCKDIA